MSQEDYILAVQQAKKYIKAGDIFQANLSLRFEARTLLIAGRSIKLCN
jgi:para-aminobenzoate synthetase component 1